MAIKCIAIGNRLMGDDQIGILVLEELALQLKTKGIETIISETDTYHALRNIENGDYLFILDSAYYNTIPGNLIFISINEAIKQRQQSFSQHEASFIHLLRSYNITVNGFIIGIEVKDIDYKTEISEDLNNKFSCITKKVEEFIEGAIIG